MKLIKVHRLLSGESVYININKIMSFDFREHSKYSSESSTLLNLNTGFYYEVIETPEEIIQLIKDAENVDGVENV